MTRLNQFIESLLASLPDADAQFISINHAIALAREIFGAPVTEKEIQNTASVICQHYAITDGRATELSVAQVVLESFIGEKP